ncbi:uncharacterized protein [Mytilus edulis]|uniref:uncharacterized protein n=1 Tax=Mytilus edulis TaxID=6550 RepID=UPI0039EECE11
MQLFILTICITFSECLIFIGFPISNWTTSSQVCSLQEVNNINTTDTFSNLSENTTFKEGDKAWTGTVIKYTKFAAFIGCGRSYSPIDSGKNVQTVEDCLQHCSDYSFASYFVLKSSKCYCLKNKPTINGDINDCRTVCTNASYTPCSSGRSALVFSFVEDIKITTTNTYIEQECVTTNRDQNRFTVSDCNAKYLYGCRNTSTELIRQSWHNYQERCLKEGSFVLFNRNTIGRRAKNNGKFWTPIFRSHALVSGKHSGTKFCVAVKKGKTNEFTVEECSRKFPFLCSRSISRNKIAYSPHIVTFPASIAAVELVVIIILVFLVVVISFKSYKRLRIYEEQLKQVNERLPGTEFSNYTGIEDSNEEGNSPGYNELSDDSTQHNESEFEPPKDNVYSQGYLMSEQHYHTIPEVEVHYAEANVAEIYGDKEHIGNGGYLVPVA